jgi:hypothetical protein
MVPNPKPPWASVFVSRSPLLFRGIGSTRGLPRTAKLLGFGKESWLERPNPRRLAIRNPPPLNPSPELSARKSPRAVASLLENRIAAQ